MKLKLLIISIFIAATTGCGAHHKTETQKEAAVAQWNATRAAVLASLARSQFEAGNLDKAQQTLNEALRMNPADANLHLLAAKIDIEQAQLEQANIELQATCTLDPKNAEAEYLSGVVNQRWQKPQLAYEAYTRASQKNPSEIAYLMARGEMLVAMNRQPEAMNVLQGGLDTFEHNALLYHAIGQLQIDAGQYSDAILSLKQAAMLAPEDSMIREHLAMAMFYGHQPREAEDLFARLVKEPDNAKRMDLHLALGECRMQLNRFSDARASFETATGLNPSSIIAWLSLGKATMQLGDARRAEWVLKKALLLDQDRADTHLLMGYVELRENKLSDAFNEFHKASSLDKNDSVSLCMIGYVLEKTGQPDRAAKSYADALKLKPDDELARRLMASVDPAP